jgi:hypothetical protein
MTSTDADDTSGLMTSLNGVCACARWRDIETGEIVIPFEIDKPGAMRPGRRYTCLGCEREHWTILSTPPTGPASEPPALASASSWDC